MKKMILCAVMLLFLFLNMLSGQIVNGRLSTSFYTFERFDTVGDSKTYIRGYQSAQFDITKNDISLHTALQAAASFKSITDERNTFKVYNIYFKWRNIFDLVDLSLGRQPVYQGVGNGLIDGGSAKLKLFDNKVILSAYGGGNVDPSLEGKITKHIKDNYLLGSQMVTNLIPDLRIGLSYMNRHRERLPYTTIRPDSIGLPEQRFIEVGSSSEQFAGVDISYSFKSLARLYGRYEHDINLEKISRGQIGARLYVTKQVALTGDFIYRQPRITYNSIFQVFNYSSNSEVEGGIEYYYHPLLNFFGKFAYVKYSGEHTQRYTVGMNAEYGSLVYSGNSGYAGELSSISAQLMYPLFDNVLTPTIGISRSSYKLTKESESFDTFTGLFGAVIRLQQSFSLDTQIQWMNNKVYKNDLRFLLKINYLFTERLNIL
jgi:hypothetical protein